MFYITIQIGCSPELLPAPAKHRTLADLKIPVARNHMNQTELEQARFNMIEQQIRPWDVLDQRVLDTMQMIPRENFVPEQYRSLAFADTNIPLGHDQVMMAPNVEGRLLQALAIQPDDTILEIGTGSGYLTACLARLGRHVTSIDIEPEFTAQAAAKLAAQGISNVTLETADAAGGVERGKSFDVIAVTGSLPLLQQQFHNNLNTGGRLFVISGQPPIMEALLITRINASSWTRESLFETSIPPLLHAAVPQRFVL
jgi:protein-L-isoaspartate(D-aspartate) O-methyltransferase